MKKLFFLATFALAAITAQAQGFVGGTFGLQNTSSNASVTKAALGIELGRQLSPNWAIAAGVNYAANYREGDFQASNFQIAPFARYTAANMGSVSLFFDGGFRMNWATTAGVKENHTNFGWGMGISPGLALRASRHVTFAANLGFVGYEKMDGREHVGVSLDTKDVRFSVYFNF